MALILCTGKIKVDKKTKNLVKRLKPHEIAIICHSDIDELAALSLIKARVKAIVNAKPSITGKYPNMGPYTLVKHNIPLIDNVGEIIMELQDGDIITIRDDMIFKSDRCIARGNRQSLEKIQAKLSLSKKNTRKNLEEFVQNTLLYAGKESPLILGDLTTPQIETSFLGKHALIVARGKNYLEDIKAIKTYIRDLKPVLVGVDGGADALVEFGCKPNLIIGDMDSVSDAALFCGSEIIVHAYPNGFAPGLKRIKDLGLSAKTFAVPGTSEDAAMLLAYHKDAELITAVGTHTNIQDFMEKGRSGMGSTMLTRIKMGDILVDAKGVSKLYGKQNVLMPVFSVVLAAIFPFIIVFFTSSLLSQLGRLILLKFRVLLNI